MRLRIPVALLAFAAVTAFLVFARGWQGFFLPHAFVVGGAVAILVYAAFGTFERLARLYRRR